MLGLRRVKDQFVFFASQNPKAVVQSIELTEDFIIIDTDNGKRSDIMNLTKNSCYL